MVKVVRKITKGDIAKIILETVKISGLLATALISPQVIKALSKIGIVDLNNKGVISNARNRLVKSGHLRTDSRGFIHLTNKGEERLKSYQLNDYELLIPKIWDKKWRMLIFDIPEYRKYTRDKIRRTLQSIGFKKLQDSVWVFPYDCSELVNLLKADFKIGKDLLYIVADQIENDKSIKNYFNL